MEILESCRRKLAHIIDEMAWQEEQVETNIFISQGKEQMGIIKNKVAGIQ